MINFRFVPTKKDNRSQFIKFRINDADARLLSIAMKSLGYTSISRFFVDSLYCRLRPLFYFNKAVCPDDIYMVEDADD